MTPEERQLITDLFARMRDFGPPEKDPQAETLINQSVRALPDAAYLFVQTLLVREGELQQSDERIQDLEARVAELEAQSAPPVQQGRSGGSFLPGGGMGRGGSVPSMGGQRAPEPQQSSSPWGRSATPAPQQGYPQQGGYQQPMQPEPAPAARSGGGFFGKAVAAAAGMAGGVMMADSIKGMMGGGGHKEQSAEAGKSNEPNSEYTLNRNGQQSASNEATDPGSYDPPAAEEEVDTTDHGSGGFDGNE